jgi:hypothetical protein
LEVNDQLHAPAALPLWKEPQYPIDKGWVGPIAGMYDVEERKFLTLQGLELLPLL